MKTYYVDQNYKILPEKPNADRIGVNEPEECIDCDYIMQNIECPCELKPIDCFNGCPLLAGNNPCSKAKKVRLIMYDLRNLSIEKKKTTQKTLLGVMKNS